MLEESVDFFDSALESFHQSEALAGSIQKFYRLAGFCFCLRFAGNAMVDLLTRALKHLEVEEGAPDLTICLWDAVSTGGPPLRYRWKRNRCAIRGEVLDYDSDRIHTLVDVHTQVLHLFDTERKIGLYWIYDWNQLPWWVGGSPLQHLLHWWMKSNGFQLTHAAVVGYPSSSVLLAGKSGSGKSTTALACLAKGIQFISEDYCLLSNTHAYSVYNSAKLVDQTLSWFPHLKSHVSNLQRATGEKAFLYHYEFQPEKILLSAPLNAIVSLKMGSGRESRLAPVPLMEAMGALSVSTMWQLTHTGPSTFNHLKQVAQSLPCYRLELGSDLDQVAATVGRLL